MAFIFKAKNELLIILWSKIADKKAAELVKTETFTQF